MIARLILRHVSPEQRLTIAAWTFDLSLIAWPVSHVLLWAMGETSPIQHAILALSWVAILVTAADVLLTADIRAQDEDAPA